MNKQVIYDIINNSKILHFSRKEKFVKAQETDEFGASLYVLNRIQEDQDRAREEGIRLAIATYFDTDKCDMEIMTEEVLLTYDRIVEGEL